MKQFKMLAMLLAVLIALTAPAACVYADGEGLPTSEDTSAQTGKGSMDEAAFTGEKISEMSLEFAVSAAYCDAGTIALDSALLIERFGEGIVVEIGEPGAKYKEVRPDENGVIRLACGENDRFVRIRQGKVTCWAGVLFGGMHIAPCAYLQYTVLEDAPGGAAPDFSAVKKVHMDAAWDDRAYAAIYDNNGVETEFWVGELPVDASGSALAVRFDFCPRPEAPSLTCEFAVVGDRRIVITFDGETKDIESVDTVEFYFIGAEGEVLGTPIVVKDPDCSPIGGYSYLEDYECPEEAVLIKGAIMREGRYLYIAEYPLTETAEGGDSALPGGQVIPDNETDPDVDNSINAAPISGHEDGGTVSMNNSSNAAAVTAAPAPEEKKADATAAPTAEPAAPGEEKVVVTPMPAETPAPTEEPSAEPAAPGEEKVVLTPMPAETPVPTEETTAAPEVTAAPEATAAPTAVPGPTAEPTPTPVPEFVVTASDYSGKYDGKGHSFALDYALGEKSCVYYMPVGEDGTWPAELKEDGWVNAGMGENAVLPEMTDVGEQSYYVLVYALDCNTVYKDAEGNTIEPAGTVAIPDGALPFVKMNVCVEKAPATVAVWAEQTGDAPVYTGDKQELSYAFKAEVEQGDPQLLDTALLTASEGWTAAGTLTGEDAGDYAVEQPGDFAYAAELYPNFDLTVVWKDSAVSIAPKPVVLTAGSAAAVHGHQETPLRSDYSQIDNLDQIHTGDRDNGDIYTAGEQDGVGIGVNEICLRENGKFTGAQHNYELEMQTGLLIVFPESISRQDEEWTDKTAQQLDYSAFKDMTGEELPGYYMGMDVRLKEDSAPYTGQEHQISVRFSKKGAQQSLVPGEDYVLEFSRDDLTSGGVITVTVRGIGNYRGEVTLEYEIEHAQRKDTAIAMDDWIYDGTAAGTAAHAPRLLNAQSGEADYIYRNAAGEEIPAPSNAGVYTVQAVWAETENYEQALSEPVEFTIRKAIVLVDFTSDPLHPEINNPLYTEGMYTWDEAAEEYVNANENFEVLFDYGGAAPVNPGARVTLAGWEYDGLAAGSEAHMPVATGMTGAEFAYADMNGESIDAPKDAGEYTVIATDVNGRSMECAFEIYPRSARITVADAEKTFGEADPDLQGALETEGVLEEDIALIRIVRDEGENAGEYAIRAEIGALGGNYLVDKQEGTLTIRPESIENVQAYLAGGSVTAWHNEYDLTEGVDFETVAGNGGTKIRGIGNFGASDTERDVEELIFNVTLLTDEGETITEKGLLTDAEGKIAFEGRVETNAAADDDEITVCVDGKEVFALTLPGQDGVISFVVGGVSPAEENADRTEISVLFRGRQMSAQTVALRSKTAKFLLLGAAIVMAAAAAASALYFVKLTKQIREEKLKLLDAASRQSNRTIRENRD